MIKVQNISKQFNNKLAVNDLSFEVGDGEILGLLGPNGAGKTTTMRIMTGFLYPTLGDVLINENSILANTVEAQKVIGYLPENNPLYKDMLVSEMLDYSCALKNLTGAAKIEAINFAVKAVSISDVYFRQISELSKGYKQRVGIALALLHKPRVLIMDEPTEGLDPNQRVEIRNLIKQLAKDHTVIISTHVMQEVELLCTRAVIINKGQKILDSPVKDIRAAGSGSKVYTFEFEGQGVESKLSTLDSVKLVEVGTSGDRISGKIVYSGKDQLQPALSKLSHENSWITWQLAEQKQQLEDIFKELTSQ